MQPWNPCTRIFVNGRLNTGQPRPVPLDVNVLHRRQRVGHSVRRDCGVITGNRAYFRCSLLKNTTRNDKWLSPIKRSRAAFSSPLVLAFMNLAEFGVADNYVYCISIVYQIVSDDIVGTVWALVCCEIGMGNSQINQSIRVKVCKCEHIKMWIQCLRWRARWLTYNFSS